MAESPDLDLRVEFSPARILEVQCPSTPGPQLNIKSPELSTSSSSEETEVARGDGTQSPPPNCAICLGRCRNKCFTDSCMHQFCFKCLLEWSKVKPECPLCKQTFKAIIHNVKSIDQFEEYLVQQPISASPGLEGTRSFTLPTQVFPRLPSIYNGRVHLYMDDLAMNTLDLTGTSSSTSNANQVAHRPAYDRRLPTQLLDMYSQETIQGEIGSGSLSQLWRRYVYDRKLYAMAMQDMNGRLRDSSARFYRDNPSQVHRLMPWINRDIVCLLRNTEHDVSSVLEQINGMLMTCNILSPEFRRRLQPFLGTKTVHFIHELNNFARSPFDMIGYDRVVQYSATSAAEIVEIEEFSTTSSADSDVENVNESHEQAGTNRRGNRQPTVTISSSGGGFTLYTTTTTSTSSQASAINLSTHNRGASGSGTSEDTTTTYTVEVVSAPTAERSTNIILSSTSSDECEFVLEQKPPHLRTPEMVSLNSDSDSDVVFVQETKTAPLPSKMWSSGSSGRVGRTHRKRTRSNINTHTFSTSNSDTDSCHFDIASTPKRSKLDDERNGHAAADATTSSTTAPKPTNDAKPKVKEEFNQGASTSTGLQSRYRSSRPNMSRMRRSRHYNDDATSDSDELMDSDSTSSESYITTEDSGSPSDSDTSWSKSRRNSNKQSLKRSRQRKITATSSSRKTRRQLSASAKSKRSKRAKSSKTVSNKSPPSAKKKKTTKRSRRKSSPKDKVVHKKRRSAQLKHEVTTEEEPQPAGDEEEGIETLTLSQLGCTIQQLMDASLPPALPPQIRSTSSSPISNSTASDATDPVEPATTSNPTTMATDSPTPVHPTLPPPPEVGDNPNANLAIYSDTD